MHTDNEKIVSLKRIRKVMKDSLGMKYSRTKKIAYIDNSDRSLILR